MNISKRRVELAILNSRYWYDAVFASHGLTSTMDEHVWRSYDVPPPFHSNLVVLSAQTGHAKIKTYISEIDERLHPAAWSVKDSYATLDLTSLQFSVLFHANWIWLNPVSENIPLTNARLSWTKLTTPASLIEWEQAWTGDAKNNAASLRSRQFPDSLLANSDLAFFAGWHQGKIVAGGIVNKSPGVAGLSNIFSPPDLLEDTWQSLKALISIDFPEKPVVGYERGTNLQLAKRAGFESTGELRVWHCGQDRMPFT